MAFADGLQIMSKLKTVNRRVDVFISKAPAWREELKALREIALDSGLTEDLKWGQPCYTLDNRNIFLIHGFKEYCAILFFKGVLLKDPKGILIRQTENVQTSRQIRFSNIQEIVKLKKVLKAYMAEAIAVEVSGIPVPVVRAKEFVIPAEIQAKLKKSPGLWLAFKKLTPGRQRAYVLHFTSAKQEKTLDSRIEKSSTAILKGKGLNE